MFRMKDLGEKPEPLILFGGPYSNLEALKALLSVSSARAIPTENLISTGDIVAYCADGEACVDLIRSTGIHVVAGNCEKQIAAAEDDCGCGFEDGSTCSLLSRGWYAHASATISDENRRWMGTCPDGITFTQNGKQFVVLHGGVSDIARFIWSASERSCFEEELDRLRAIGLKPDVVITGHSGIAFEKDLRGVQWLNAGALGMPENDGTTNTRFALLKDGEVSIETLKYDFEKAALKMEQAGLTQGYQDALRTGLWPSEDVLPAELRRNSA